MRIFQMAVILLVLLTLGCTETKANVPIEDNRVCGCFPGNISSLKMTECKEHITHNFEVPEADMQKLKEEGVSPSQLEMRYYEIVYTGSGKSYKFTLYGVNPTPIERKMYEVGGPISLEEMKREMGKPIFKKGGWTAFKGRWETYMANGNKLVKMELDGAEPERIFSEIEKCL